MRKLKPITWHRIDILYKTKIAAKQDKRKKHVFFFIVIVVVVFSI